MNVPALTEEQLANWVPELDTPVWDRYPVCTSANAQEVYPGVGDPLSFDVNLLAIEDAERRFFDEVGLAHQLGADRWRTPGFFAAYYGHVFINISAFREAMKYLPGGDPDALDEQLFGQARDPASPRWKPTPVQRLLRARSLFRLLPVIRRLPGEIAAHNTLVERELQRIQSLQLPHLSDEQLWRELERGLALNDDSAALHILTTLLGSNGLENLRKFLQVRQIDNPDAAVAKLSTGLEDVESARPARALWAIAAHVKADDLLRGNFLTDPPTEVLEHLRHAETPAGRMVWKELQRFLTRYGYRGMRELGLTAMVWGLRPDPVIELIKTYIERGDDFSPETNLAEQRQVRQQAMERIGGRLSPLRRWQLRSKVKAAHQAIESRELTKSQWVRTTHALRLLFREVGRRLAERRRIASADDIYFLRLAELTQLFHGQALPDVSGRISRRREDYARCLNIETEERFSGRPRPLLATREQPALPVKRLTGLAVSPGHVRGRARVVTELRDDVELEPGEILVCPFTDAAWTPLFFAASGVVMDLGGPLSHGATVAREYGLPAVVNVKTGTRTIRPGQEISVDGSTGVVILHDRSD